METTVCHGGQPCPVQWLDDGEQPLLTTMGPCYVSLYAGNEARLYVHVHFFIWSNVAQVLIQQIEPVDVSTTHSLTFTVNHIYCIERDFCANGHLAKSQCCPQLKHIV